MTEKPRFTLYLSGGWHITSTNSRIEGLPVDPDTIDVVFEENATHNPPSTQAILANWVVSPLICLFIKLYLVALAGAARVGVTDSGIIDKLENAGAEVIQTDRNYHRMMASERRFWGLGHWAFVSMIFFGIKEWLQSVTPILSIPTGILIGIVPNSLQSVVVLAILGLAVVVWFLFAGAIMGWFFIIGTIETRNYAIVHEIERHLREHPQQSTGCLVVGDAHIPHLRELICESELVELGEI